MSLSDLDYDSNEVSENSHYGAGNEDKDEHTSDSFFEVGIFSKEMACVKKKADQENHPQDDGENGSNGIRNIINRIFNTTNLCEKRT